MSNTAIQPPPEPAPAAAAPPVAPRVVRRQGVVGALYRCLKALASLRLTVVLFVLSLALVFLGTLAQIDAGIWTVVNQYFRSFLVWIPFQLLLQFGQVFFGVPHTWSIPGAFPFPGGWLLGFLLLANLLAAHLVRFRLSWKRSGILLIHGGLILMMVGEFITGVYAVEGNMVIDEGGASNFVILPRFPELAVVDSSGAVDDVVVVPAALLQKGGRISHPDLPFDVEVVRYMINSALQAPAGENLATEGAGREAVAVEQGEVSGTSTKQTMEMPSAYLTFHDKQTDKPLGTWLVSYSEHIGRQTVEAGGKTFDVTLRPRRIYKPYTLQLIDFRFDRFMGTSTARNYSSLVRLLDPERGEDRQVLIRMNEPLRHRGDTLYQSSFDKTETTTILQVVRNPGWMLPYFSCAIVGLGMLVHFGLHLIGFLQRRAAL